MKTLAVSVRVRDLRVVRGSGAVLDRLDLELRAGEVTGLLGPSGCGKTTLMRALVGVQQVDGGQVDVLGEPAGAPENRRRVGYLTQSPSVYGNLSVDDNLRFFAAVLGAPTADVDWVLDQVDLADHAARPVHALSGGQRSRVSLAVALLGAPAVLVLDEPTVGLDPVLRRDLWTLFHALADDGRTVLVSSHVMDEAGRCDRLLLMRDGEIIADDSPEGLLAATGAADVEQAFLRIVEDGRPLAGSRS